MHWRLRSAHFARSVSPAKEIVYLPTKFGTSAFPAKCYGEALSNLPACPRVHKLLSSKLNLTVCHHCASPRLRECCRQVEAEMVSNNSNRIHPPDLGTALQPIPAIYCRIHRLFYALINNQNMVLRTLPPLCFRLVVISVVD